jgi:hypothetical protein
MPIGSRKRDEKGVYPTGYEVAASGASGERDGHEAVDVFRAGAGMTRISAAERQVGNDDRLGKQLPDGAREPFAKAATLSVAAAATR